MALKKPGLKKVRFEYCTKIGDLAIQSLTKRYWQSLEEVAIIRNYFEKTAKISDDSFKQLQNCQKLKKLELTYSRRFEDKIALNLGKNFPKLKVLNLSHCPIQVTLEPLCDGCPNLEELNLGGDSWVRR